MFVCFLHAIRSVVNNFLNLLITRLISSPLLLYKAAFQTTSIADSTWNLNGRSGVASSTSSSLSSSSSDCSYWFVVTLLKISSSVNIGAVVMASLSRPMKLSGVTPSGTISGSMSWSCCRLSLRSENGSSASVIAAFWVILAFLKQLTMVCTYTASHEDTSIFMAWRIDIFGNVFLLSNALHSRHTTLPR